MQAILDVKSLSFSRDGRPLASELAFAVAPGEVWQVAGDNGAGKTTLLRIIAGLYSGYEGEIRFAGEALWQGQGRADFSLESHYLGHQAAIKSVLTPRENLRWQAALQTRCADDAAIDQALAKVGLKGREDIPCRQLSAGQQRRAALARLFLVPVKLWLLDEPFTALDRPAVAALEGWIGEFAAAGGAVLLTTHHELRNVPALRTLHLGAAAHLGESSA